MLVNSQVNHVHCCEWNPNAIRALKWSLGRNNVANRCTIPEGDNRLTATNLSGQADRVILDYYLPQKVDLNWLLTALRKLEDAFTSMEWHQPLITILGSMK